jgi:hypothetical protein
MMHAKDISHGESSFVQRRTLPKVLTFALQAIFRHFSDD